MMTARSPEEEPEDPHGEDRANASTRPHDSNVDHVWEPPGLAEYEQIRDLIDRGSLLEALRGNLSLALQLMAQDAKADPLRRQEFISNLTSQLQQRATDYLSLARARAEISDEPQQISQDLAIALSEAAKLLPDRVPASSLLRSLKSFPPLAIIPNLIAFLGVARDGPVRDAAFELFEYLIFPRLAAYASDSPEARRCRDLTLPFFAAILDPGGPALDEQERATVASIILRCAGTLGGDLHAVIARLAQLSHIGVEPMGLRLYPGALSLLLHSKEPKHRIEAVRCLGAYGPTVAEVQKLLYLAGEDDNQELREEAAAALAQNRARGKGQGADTPRQPSLTREVRTREEVAFEATAAVSSELIIHFVEPSRLLISTRLTLLPILAHTPPVGMDASQEVSPGSTAAPSPDLDLSSHQITMNSGGDGYSPPRSDATTSGVHTDQLDLASESFSFTTADLAVLRARTLLVSEPAEDLSRLDVFEHGRTLLRCIVHESPSEEQVQLYLDRLHKTDFSKLSIPEKQMIARTVNRLVEAGELGLYLQKDESGEGGLNRVTKISCYVPKRSKGSIQAREGNVTHYTGTTWPQLIVKSSLPARLDEEKFE